MDKKRTISQPKIVLNSQMNQSSASNFTLGVDEVGRGALAGPVCLAGVLLPQNLPLQTFIADFNNPFFEQNPELKFVRDSKKLSPEKRQKVVNLITQKSLPNLILYSSNQLIDEFGIGVCLSTMLVLIVNLLGQNHQIKKIIVDGKIKLLSEINPQLENSILAQNNLHKPKNGWNENLSRVERLNFADDNFLSVALASSLAKVNRDRLMEKLSLEFPNFGWNQNKGYGTHKHRLEIAKERQNIHLRQSFLSKIL